MSGEITPGSAWRHSSPSATSGRARELFLHEENHSRAHQKPQEILKVWVMHIFNVKHQLPYLQLSWVVTRRVVRSWRAKPASGSHAGIPWGYVTAPPVPRPQCVSCTTHQCEGFGMPLEVVWEFSCLLAVVSEAGVQKFGVHCTL